MAVVADYVLDKALAVFDTEANRIDICSQAPTTFTEATATYTLGNKTSIAIGAPADASPDGREVTTTAITDGSVTGTGTATHYAITDTVNSRLLAYGALGASQAVTNGNIFTLPSFKIRMPDSV